MLTQKPVLLYWKQKVPHREDGSISSQGNVQSVVLPEEIFVRLLRLERRRTERSAKPFLLVLISSEEFRSKEGDALFRDLAITISSSTRETDLLGWYERDVTLGILMTEIGQAGAAAVEAIVQKISIALGRAVKPESFCRLALRFRVFPQEATKQSREKGDDVLYPDLSCRHDPGSKGNTLKRTLDIFGSLVAIILFFPIFGLIALLVKLTSKGPMLFCQKRIGQYDREFTFFKFRTMYVDNDPRIHQEYVAKLIAGDNGLAQGDGIYKLVNDPRVTALGRFLRKTSLDELPQFLNVLMNDMSLVGPRPPLPYEYERYQAWHRRRILEIKPGITGLWQVKGRSRTTFDEMVRMDISYARMRSLWLDLKILLQTPAAMFSGRGAC
jgi:lipopolysaccharide/colanic/teichoic acid biosynthesis glycosyltransferase